MNGYTLGTQITLFGNFTLADGATYVDPTMVTCKVRRPSGALDDLTGSITKSATGKYSAPYNPATIGQYSYEFIGTGAVIAACVGSFSVTTSTF